MRIKASHRREEREIGKRVAEDGEAHDLREVGFRPISGNIWAISLFWRFKSPDIDMVHDHEK
jgi:hypothetical protein